MAFSMVMNNSYKIFHYSQNELGSLSKAATIMRDFERTARGASEFQGQTFDDFTASKLTFYAYQRGDTYQAPSKISYYFDSGTSTALKKSVTTPEGTGPYTYDGTPKITTFAGEIANHNIFTYFGENSAQLTGTIQPANIRMIKINVTVVGKVSATETTAVQLRNLKTNL